MNKALPTSEIQVASFLLLILALAAMVSGCTNADDRASTANSELSGEIVAEGHAPTLPANAKLVAGVLDSLEFSEQVNQRPSCISYTEFRSGMLVKPEDLPQRELTAGQERVIGGWVKPDSTRTNLIRTLDAIRYFEKKYERMPINGQELVCGLNAQLSTHTGLNEFQDKTIIDQLNEVAYAVNPSTGQFYRFDSSDWHANGIYVKQLSADEIDDRYPGMTREPLDVLHDVQELWEISVFGEQQDEILLQKEVIVAKSPASPTSQDEMEAFNPCASGR